MTAGTAEVTPSETVPQAVLVGATLVAITCASSLPPRLANR